MSNPKKDLVICTTDEYACPMETRTYRRVTYERALKITKEALTIRDWELVETEIPESSGSFQICASGVDCPTVCAFWPSPDTVEVDQSAEPSAVFDEKTVKVYQIGSAEDPMTDN